MPELTISATLTGIHRYDVFYQQDLAVCFTHAINTTMPKPDLTALNYIGKAVIGQEPVYHWYIQVPAQVRPRHLAPDLLEKCPRPPSSLTLASLHRLARRPCSSPRPERHLPVL